MRPARYEIHVDGVLPADELNELVGMTATDDGSSTVLRCVIPDQPTLVGVHRPRAAAGRSSRPGAAGQRRSTRSAGSADPSRSWWRPPMTAGARRRGTGSASAVG